MNIIKGKEIVISLLRTREAEILTALLRADDIPYSMSGSGSYSRITIPLEYANRITVVCFEWETLSANFRGEFNG